MVQIEFDGIVFKEGKTFLAYSPKLDVSSCGDSVDGARSNLKTAIRLFIEEADTERIWLQKTTSTRWVTPRLVLTEHISLEA